MQGAVLVAAEFMAVFVNVGEQTVETVTPNHVLGRPAGDLLRRPIPIDDAAIDVGHVHPVAQGVQDEPGVGT